MFSQLFAGTGLGLVVGFLVGLSTSPVVSVVVGALAAGMVTFLGFTRSGKDVGVAYDSGSTLRLGAFGIACAASVLVGLFVRTHNWLSPSISDQVAEVRKAGYSDEEARRWVAEKNIGAPFTSSETHVASLKASDGGAIGSVLFSSGNSGECQHFDTNRYKDVPEHLYALKLLGGKYGEYAEKISTLDAGHQKIVLDSLRLLFCPQ
jgi:hypothetical protein